MNIKKLEPIKESPTAYESLEEEIVKVLRREIFLPIVKLAQLPMDVIANSVDKDPLLDAIMTGRIVHSKGYFRGRMTAAITRALKSLGAKWDRQQRTFKISLSDLPDEYRVAIRMSDDRFKQVLRAVDNKLSDILPDLVAEKMKLEDKFDTSIFKIESDFKSAIKNITVAPSLPKERLETIAREYSQNMKLGIKDWTTKEIKSLRQEVMKSTFSGNRYEALFDTVNRSYGATVKKAKFIARQETNLLLASYKKSRLLDAGLPEYEWCCVKASAAHPVRPMHKALEGKIFRWDSPPIVNEKGDRKNPGEDFGCRCYARPVVRF